MSEKISVNSTEKVPQSPEQQSEQYERLAKDLEQRAESSKTETAEQRTESAKADVLKLAESSEKKSSERQEHRIPASARRRGISKKERDASFQQRMTHVRSSLSAPERAFSKFIHAKAVERTSEVLGSTIARPNAILAGAVVSFIAVLGVYLVAKNLGYPLSGFESIGAFVIGWIIGLLYDFFRIMITGKK